MTDLIELFKEYSRGLPSCPLYREWCGVVLVAGALERRVWAEYGRMTAFSNLSVMLVGPPGAGKGVILCVRDLWKRTLDGEDKGVFHVGRKSYTKASLVDDIKDSSKVFVSNSGDSTIKYHSLLLASEEFPILFPKFDLEFLGFLSDLWNADDIYDERRRASEVKSVRIEFPIITALMGYQPAVMAQTFPPTAFDQGFMRRTIMVWNGIPELQSLFDADPFNQKLELQICSRLRELSLTFGRMKWEREAAQRIESWHMGGGEPRPTHLRLQGYCNTRSHLAIKLAIAISMAEDLELVIRLSHMNRAISLLLETEALMPDIFRAMIGDSDTHLISDTHNMLIAAYAKTRPKGVHGEVVWTFLKDRAPSNKIHYIINTMEKSGLIERELGTDFWRPKLGVSRGQ